MLIETLSVFPEMFEPVMSTSILGRARKAGLFDFKAYNLRDWTHDRHRTVDDEPYGGGQGMLMKVEPIAEAIEAISAEGPKPTVVFFTPCGEPFTQHVAERLLKSERLLFVCSRYEGVDERAYAYADERLSIGDYVLTGGELPAMVVADAVVRLIPGALGDEMSNVDESFSTAEDGGLLEYAQYTRPAEFNGEGVPPVLVSGDHAKVDAWRRKNAIERTCRWRPDSAAHARGARLRAGDFGRFVFAERGVRMVPSQHSALRGAFEWIAVIAIALVATFLIRSFVVEPFVVPTGSMESTIEIGDQILAQKVSLELGQPVSQGDIVVFHNPDGTSEHDVLVKRVIATAGQTVDLQDGKVVVDGQALDEDYTTGMSWPLSVQAPGAQVSYPYTVPDGCVWVMGDNRENSADSRYFGPVDRSDLIAVALVRYWPLNRIGAID